MVEDVGKSQLKDMDEYLKVKLVDLWFDAINLSVVGDYKKTFKAYKMMFKMVEPYDFTDKLLLQELTEILQEYLNSLGGRPVSSSEAIQFNNRKEEFSSLLDKYTSFLPKAFVDLNLWFKAIPKANDFDLKFSSESFGSDLTLIDKKKKALSKLGVSELLELFSVNALHDAHARGVNRNVL